MKIKSNYFLLKEKYFIISIIGMAALYIPFFYLVAAAEKNVRLAKHILKPFNQF